MTHILERPNDHKRYGLATFIDKRYTLSDIPEAVQALLADEVQIKQPVFS